MYGGSIINGMGFSGEVESHVFFFLAQVNVVTQRGFVPVDERMRVIDANGELVSNYILASACEWSLL